MRLLCLHAVKLYLVQYLLQLSCGAVGAAGLFVGGSTGKQVQLLLRSLCHLVIASSRTVGMCFAG